VLSDRCWNSSRHFTRHLHSLQTSLGVRQTNKPLRLAPGLKHVFGCPVKAVIFLFTISNQFFQFLSFTCRSVLELLNFLYLMHNRDLAAHSYTLLVSCQLGSSFFQAFTSVLEPPLAHQSPKGSPKKKQKTNEQLQYPSHYVVSNIFCNNYFIDQKKW